MKTISLHEKYNRNQVGLLIEQLDLADLQNISNTFDRIDVIIGNLDSKLPSIDGPIEKARQNLANIVGNQGW